MPVDLFFLNTMPQNPTTSFRGGNAGPGSGDRISGSSAMDKSFEGRPKSFAETLRKASEDRNAAAGSKADGCKKSIATKKAGLERKDDRTTDPVVERDEESSEKSSAAENRASREMDLMPFGDDLSAIMDLLENLGLRRTRVMLNGDLAVHGAQRL